RLTRIAIRFKQPPLRLFSRTRDILRPNELILTLQPREEIILHFGVKDPRGRDRLHPVRMEFDYARTFQTGSHSPYERLLIDCLRGDPTLFVRQDGVEAQWAAVDPIIARWESRPPPDFPNYPAGSWGPDEKAGSPWREFPGGEES
ncbi:MAG: hypothetical protein P9M08_04880, partial [Candidatus Erginobacter occultus]|nr:hypothetical protein [Candidatus Erginobacter occultus]